MIGLPGNPVSAMVCGEVFVQPVIRKFLGLPTGPRPRQSARLSHDLGENGPREHYMRAKLRADGQVEIFSRQDSSLLTVLSDANALVIRDPKAPSAKAGESVEIIELS